MIDNDLGCNTLECMAKEYLELLDELVQLPFALLKGIDALARKAQALASGLLKDLEDALNLLDGIPNSLNDFLSGLQKLISCPALPSSVRAMLQSQYNILLAAGDLSALADDFKDFIDDNITGALNGMMRKAMNESIYGKLNALQREYDNILTSTGVYDTIEMIDDIIQCLSGACGSYDFYADKLSATESDLRIDPSTGKAKTNLSEDSPGITDTVKTNISDSTNMFSNMQSRIDSTTFF